LAAALVAFVEEAMSVASTITPVAAAETLWDVIVIGGGPAGAIAARELARRGARVLLIERESFPRAKVCGGCLNGRALDALSSVGLDDVLAAAHAAPVRSFVVQAARRCAMLDLPTGVVIDRASFDAALVEAAVAAGADFTAEATATVGPEVNRSHACRRVELRPRVGPAAHVRGRVVLAADGLGHPSLRHIGIFHSRTPARTRVGLGARILASAESLATDAIHMAVARQGYVGLARTADGHWNVAAAVDPASLRAADSPARLIEEILVDAGMPAPSLEEAHFRGTLPLTRASDRLVGDRICLLGDAAGYVEPFTGEGMGTALASALSIVDEVLDSLQLWDESRLRRWEQKQLHYRSRGQFACRVLSTLLRRPTIVSVSLRAVNAFPSVVRPLVRRIQSNPNTVCASAP
jgi:flavin-dependent dehydrogenase